MTTTPHVATANEPTRRARVTRKAPAMARPPSTHTSALTVMIHAALEYKALIPPPSVPISCRVIPIEVEPAAPKL